MVHFYENEPCSGKFFLDTKSRDVVHLIYKFVHQKYISCTWRFAMNYSKEERIEIGRKIHEAGISNLKAAELFGIAEESARRYRILYEESVGIPHNSSTLHKGNVSVSGITTALSTKQLDSVDYSSMTKEELIQELMEVRIREERLKKGYMVKGVGAEKEFIPLDNKNIK